MIIVLLTFQFSKGQKITIPELPKNYPFIKEDINLIGNSNELVPLMEKLRQLKKGSNKTINILHIGDSHLQADFMTNVIRITLQQAFGNSGRGLIFPYRLAKTNEPFNYRTSTNVVWDSKRCVFPNLPLQTGICGVTISSSDTSANFTIKTKSDSILNYDYNKITLIYQKDSLSYNFAFSDSTGTPLGIIYPIDTTQNQSFTSSITFPQPKNKVSVQVRKNTEFQKRAMIYGIELENGKPGILYHTIGVNGAMYINYTESEYFAEQTKLLKPDLIILSLGTNEAFSFGFKEDEFRDNILQLFSRLKMENPDAIFLLTTPASSFRRKKPNPRMAQAAQTIVSFANEHKVPYWDLQEVTGGANSALNWKKYHMMRPDGVHYNINGYELQGNLFCKAFFKTFNDYAANRPE